MEHEDPGYNQLILGSIYDPDTDSYLVVMRMSSVEFDKWQIATEEFEEVVGPELEIDGIEFFGPNARVKKRDGNS